MHFTNNSYEINSIKGENPECESANKYGGHRQDLRLVDSGKGVDKGYV